MKTLWTHGWKSKAYRLKTSIMRSNQRRNMVSIEGAVPQCGNNQCVGTPEEKHFLSLLLASAEYDCYYNVMVREARKQRSRIESKQ